MPHSVQRRMQRLRSKLGYVRYGVTTRVASTISNIRDKSYAYAGFQTARPTGAGQDDAGDLCRARMQLRNTVVRWVAATLGRPCADSEGQAQQSSPMCCSPTYQ